MKIFVVNWCYDDFSDNGNIPILGFSCEKKAKKFLKDVKVIGKMNDKAIEKAKKLTEKEFSTKQDRSWYFFENKRAQAAYFKHIKRFRVCPPGLEKAFKMFEHQTPAEGFSITEIEVEID